MCAEAAEISHSLRIALCREQDLADIAAILRSCPEAALWSLVSLQGMLQERPDSMLMAWQHEQIKGFVAGRRVADELEILNLAVRPEARRCGIGKALVQALLRTLRGSKGQVRIFLEVRESNSAGIAFYRGLGFQQTGRRKDYYRDPTEAALVFSLSS
jgi:[ribosomal protein S18]-alanine N-acetyltransferase